MSDDKKDTQDKKVTLKGILKGMFEDQSDEIVIFDPKKPGDYVIGKVADSGISKEFNTPFLVLLDKNGEEITVFIKMGILPKMRRKKWITIEDTWNEEVVNQNMGKLIAFQFVEKATSERTKRKFQKYKVLFPKDLEEEGVTDFQ